MTRIVRLFCFVVFNQFELISFYEISVEEKKVKSLEHILETRKKVKLEIAQLKEKLQQTREKIAEFKDAVSQGSQP